MLADRYANSNVMKAISLHGIQERSERFIERCTKSVGRTLDLFVRFPRIRNCRPQLGHLAHVVPDLYDLNELSPSPPLGSPLMTIF